MSAKYQARAGFSRCERVFIMNICLLIKIFANAANYLGM